MHSKIRGGTGRNTGGGAQARPHWTQNGAGARARRRLGALGLALLAACSAGGDSGAPGAEEGMLGGAAGAAGGSRIIAELELVAPPQEHFLLHGTLPLPPGVVNDGDLLTQLQVLRPGGAPAPTQVEIVSRYPNSRRDGADVVEITAFVDREVAPGERTSYRVRVRPHRPGEFGTRHPVRSFFASPSSLVLTTHDVFGNRYKSDLLRDVRTQNGRAELLQDGELVREWKTHTVLQPSEVVEGAHGTLPHMMGVHAFVKQFSGEEFFTVDLRVHNGMAGRDTENPLDDALDDIYFDELTLRVPAGWQIISAFQDTALGEQNTEDGWSTVDLIDAQPSGAMHVMRRQGQLLRRLVIARQGAEARARAMLTCQNLAFARAGVSPEGEDYWSWWNPLTARYFPQNHRLPSFAHLDAAPLREGMRTQLAEYMGYLANGNGNNFPLVSPASGYARPWGAHYGGMTGGVEIDLFGGQLLAALASREGYRMEQLTARMYLDREPICLYELDGEPTKVEDWLREGNHGKYFPGLFNLQPLLPGNDPFGFGNAPTFQTEAVVAMGKVPDYQTELMAYKAIDCQHWTRYTRHLKVLAWLGNDSLAKSELRMAAEVYRLSYHEFLNSGTGIAQSWGLRYAIDSVAEHPGQGLGFGRAAGWGLDVSAAAYALADNGFRRRFYGMFSLVAQLVEDGQSDCGGYLQAQPHHSNDGLYRIRQNYEAAICEHALRGVAESVFRGANDNRAEQIDQVMVEQAYGTISDAFWDSEHGGPHGTVAVGPHDADQPPYCGVATAVWASPELDHKYYWNSLAYAYEYTGDDAFLVKAAEMADTGNLFNYLQGNATGDVANRGVLLALMQEMNGIH